MATRLLPALLITLLPLDLVAGLAARMLPSQATLMALGGTLTGLYLARQLWWGGAARLEAQSRLNFLAEKGRSFEPDSEEALIRLENSRLNYLLGGGLLLFGVVFTLAVIGSYMVTTAIAATPTLAGQAVQLGILLIFTLLVIVLELFGAAIFLKR